MRRTGIWICLLALAPLLAACAADDDLGRSLAAHSEADAGPPDAGPPDAGPPDRGCTLTQGYWKNHPEAWPVSSLTLGSRTYSRAQLLALLRTPSRGDASLILAHQLIAAMLNVLSGASGVSAIAVGQVWLSTYDPGFPLPYGVHAGSAEGGLATAIADRLADYNEGLSGPGHCGD